MSQIGGTGKSTIGRTMSAARFPEPLIVGGWLKNFRSEGPSRWDSRSGSRLQTRGLKLPHFSTSD
jgi:hypothetical protein